MNPIVASNSVRNSILASFRLFAYCNLHNLNHFSIFTATKVACQKCNQYTTKLSSIRQREAIKEFHFSCFPPKMHFSCKLYQQLAKQCKDDTFCNFIFSSWGLVSFMGFVTMIGISLIFKYILKVPIYKIWIWSKVWINQRQK